MEWAVGLQYVNRGTYIQANNELFSISEQRHSGFLPNGGRCYKDNAYLEYATGEEDTFIGTVASEIAGEQIVHERVKNFVDASEDPAIANYRLFKRVNFGRKVMSGYHINLCGDATRFELNSTDLYDMALWAATASMYIGAGSMYQSTPAGPLRPAIAQKTIGITDGFSSGTMSQKPLVVLRGEPHGDPNKYRRVQVVGIDANISPWASWMALGTASLCLRAIEQNRRTEMRLRSLPFADPLAYLAKRVAFNTSLDTAVDLDDGRTLTALQIQKELYENAAQTEHTEEEKRVLENWEAILADIEGSRSMIRQKTGWSMRLQAICRYAKKHDLLISDPQLLVPDYRWDSMGPDNVADKLRRTIWKDDMPDSALIADRRDNPCPTTRATLRAEAIRENKNKWLKRVDWAYYTFEKEQPVRLSDPLMTEIVEDIPDNTEDDDYEAASEGGYWMH